MKNDAFSKLTEITLHVAQLDGERINPEEKLYLLNELRSIFVLEAAEVKIKMNKFNIWKCTSNDEMRPIMGGCHYEGGCAVASDACILAVEKCDYLPEWEGTTREKDGKEIHGKYPNWQSVIPVKENVKETAAIDDAILLEAQNEIATRKKLGEKFKAVVKVGDSENGTWLALKHLLTAKSFCEAHGYPFEAHITDKRRAVRFGNLDGFENTLIAMPVNVDEKKLMDENNGVLPKVHYLCA